MNRRDFVRASLAASLLPVTGRGATSRTGAIPVIDTHTHFYDPTRPQGVPWPRPTEKLLYAPFLPDTFRAATNGLNVVGTVVIEASPWVEDNQWLLDLAATTPEIVAVVGQLKLGEPAFAENLSRFSANPLFRGLRLGLEGIQAQTKAAVRADLTRLADEGLSLDVLGRGSLIEPVTRLAKTWPTLRIVVDHLPFPEWNGNVDTMRGALRDVARCPNVFAKLSGVVQRVHGELQDDVSFYRPQLDALVDLFGPKRIVHGTNWPVSERVAPYATVHRVMADYFATKEHRLAENYFWRNSAEAYRWVRRGAATQLS